MINKIFRSLLNKARLDAPYALWRTGYLRENGWFNSYYSTKVIDANHQPIPWYSYPAIDFLEPHLTKDLDIFEYGCGNSTMWYATRVNSVTSVEHDPDWFELVSRKIPDNCKILKRSLGDSQYTLAITQQNKQYDLIAVDGRDRVNCVKNCTPFLKEWGVLLLDNSERPSYQEALQVMKDSGFKRIDFIGMGPIYTAKTMTSIFFKENSFLFS